MTTCLLWQVVHNMKKIKDHSVILDQVNFLVVQRKHFNEDNAQLYWDLLSMLNGRKRSLHVWADINYFFTTKGLCRPDSVKCDKESAVFSGLVIPVSCGTASSRRAPRVLTPMFTPTQQDIYIRLSLPCLLPLHRYR